MELVYLWVEDYKNIHHQGFNFSSRFACKYDDVVNELTIDENKEYVSIFPDNINVTAIVGENGSGKSSVLAGINKDKIIFKIGDNYFSRGFDLRNIKSSLEIKENDIDILKHVIYLDFDLIKFPPMKDYWDYTMSNIYDRNLYKNIENSIPGDINFSIPKYINNFYNLIMEHITSFESKLFFFNPQEIIFNDYLHEVPNKEERWLNINQLIKQVATHPFSKERFLLFLFSQIQVNLELSKVKKIEDLLTHEQTIFEHFTDLKIENTQHIYDFFNAFDSLSNKTQIVIKDFIPLYKTHKEAFLQLINIAYLQINFTDALQREYSDLSQGERKLFTEMLMIFDAIKKNDKNDKNDILVVLDEPDLTLHPEWQKKYLNEMIKLLSNFSDKNFHLLVTTHSPFILSDLPKDNVIFLEKYKKDEDKNQKEGNCKNVSKDITIDTFGANIHTLLSHGFFMDGGLMGEFAKEKINEAICNLQDRSQTLSQKQIKAIVKTIGEPFLQKKLEQMYNEKFGLDDELEELQKQQEKINLKIEQLKKQKSENVES